MWAHVTALLNKKASDAGRLTPLTSGSVIVWLGVKENRPFSVRTSSRRDFHQRRDSAWVCRYAVYEFHRNRTGMLRKFQNAPHPFSDRTS